MPRSAFNIHARETLNKPPEPLSRSHTTSEFDRCGFQILLSKYLSSIISTCTFALARVVIESPDDRLPTDPLVFFRWHQALTCRPMQPTRYNHCQIYAWTLEYFLWTTTGTNAQMSLTKACVQRISTSRPRHPQSMSLAKLNSALVVQRLAVNHGSHEEVDVIDLTA